METVSAFRKFILSLPEDVNRRQILEKVHNHANTLNPQIPTYLTWASGVYSSNGSSLEDDTRYDPAVLREVLSQNPDIVQFLKELIAKDDTV
jgi:hypothetical protein